MSGLLAIMATEPSAVEIKMVDSDFSWMVIAGSMSQGAIIEDTFRYALWRRWGPGPVIVFLMLNPSTADGLEDDPTIRRCIGFAKSLGGGALVVVNLYAFRSTEPDALLADTAAKVGPRNDAFILRAAAMAVNDGMVICAWGAHKAAAQRAKQVTDLLREGGVELTRLRMTKSGQPSHPLYLPANLRPIPME